MASVFTKIISGELPAYIIHENDKFISFLDVNPNAKGHTLCVPKQEVDKLFDLDEELYLELMIYSRKVALALDKSVECKRVGLSVIGLEVPHVHVHLIPLNTMEDARFVNKQALTDDEFKSLASKIAANL